MRAKLPPFLLCLALGAAACKAPPPAETAQPSPPEAAAQAAPSPPSAALAKAEAAVDRLAATLRAKLVAAMQEGGPTLAMKVCSQEAQALGAQVQAETGVEVGRSSLRLRNPKNAPRPWVEAWLREMGERPAAEAEGSAELVEGKALVLRPIAVEAPCLSCHGPEETISAEVKELLAANYPEDRARGYRAGDLRGAFWAELPAVQPAAGETAAPPQK